MGCVLVCCVQNSITSSLVFILSLPSPVPTMEICLATYFHFPWIYLGTRPVNSVSGPNGASQRVWFCHRGLGDKRRQGGHPPPQPRVSSRELFQVPPLSRKTGP